MIEHFGASGREELTVMVEVPELAAHGAAVKEDLERRLKEVVGLRTIVSPVGVRELDPHTGLSGLLPVTKTPSLSVKMEVELRV